MKWLILAVLVLGVGFLAAHFFLMEANKLNAPSRMFYVYGELNKLDPDSVESEVKNITPEWKTLSNEEYKKLLNDQHIYDDKLFYDFWSRPYVVSLKIAGDQKKLEWALISLGPSGISGSEDNYRIEGYKINHN